MKTGSHFWLAVILLLLFAAAPADARPRAVSGGRTYAVQAWACDPVSKRCALVTRNFRNPVWR